ncbi:MAG: hypothetical protein QMD71_09970 [bacterium]|nr:hypothetical protein [bacterium]
MVSFKVYNIVAELVATLVNEETKVGYYSVDWDANGVSCGMYFLQFEVGDKIVTKKMVLVK